MVSRVVSVFTKTNKQQQKTKQNRLLSHLLCVLNSISVYCVQAAEDVNVTFEDQQKINKFARNTSRITELKEEIEDKKVA